MVLITHLDDTGIISTEGKQIKAFKERLGERFAITENDMREFIGINISRNRQGRTLALNQAIFVETILKKLNMSHLRGAAVPALPGITLSKQMSPTTDAERQEMSTKPYRLTVGSLNYLALLTRPDILNAVRAVSRYMSDPGLEHWEAVKQICKYLMALTSLPLRCTAD